jgi:hypothetical protein
VNGLIDLPDLGRVPRAYTVYRLSPLSAKVALALLDTEYGHFAGDASMAADVISRVLRGWIDALVSIPPDPRGKTLADKLGARRINHLVRAAYTEADGEFEIALQGTGQGWYNIGKRLKDAEQLRGLGQSALVALARAADASLPILLPHTLIDMAGPRKYLREHLKSFPAWVLDPQPLSRRSLDFLANPKRTKFTGRLARAILAVEAAVAAAKDVRLPAMPADLTAYPLVLQWETGDRYSSAFTAITDDHRHRAGELATIFRIGGKPGPNLARNLQAFLSSIAATAPVLRAVSALVDVLSSTGKTNDDD